MNLVLIGYRGTGKSTIGKRLSEVLEMSYISTDEEIVRRAGMTIPEIVSAFSWDHFRELEAEVIPDVAARDHCVIDTGGGVVTRRENVRRLKRNGLVFLLEARISDIIDRIRDGVDRPSLTGEQDFLSEVEQVLSARRPLYQEAADYVVNTSDLDVEAAVQEIARRFRGYMG